MHGTFASGSSCAAAKNHISLCTQAVWLQNQMTESQQAAEGHAHAGKAGSCNVMEGLLALTNSLAV